MSPRGRKPIDADDPSVSINVRLPSKQYDALCVRAIREHVSLPEMIRRDLKQKEITTRDPLK